MTKALKPCPFCGGTPHMAFDKFTYARIVCNGCGASTDGYGGSRTAAAGLAAAAWNKRVEDDPDDTSDR